MNSAENLCGSQAKHYYMCKRERDAQIFTAIRTWEIEKFQEKDLKKEDVREDYIGKIESEKSGLEDTLTKTPISIGNKHRRWRM